MIKKIGDYYLNQDINSANGLEEFAKYEYGLAKEFGMEQIFEDEKMFFGNNVDFLGFSWESTIDSTQGKIYKIALQLNPDSKNEMNNIFNSVSNYIKDENGESSQQSTKIEM